MHLILTDQLSCPRCGPEYGLILLADRVEARRVHEGRLGCANCESKYPVRDGVADFSMDAVSPPIGANDIEAGRLAALLGVAQGPAMLLLLGHYDDVAVEIADMLDDVEVIVAHGVAHTGAERMGVSKILIGDVIPLRNRSMRGVAIGPDASRSLLREAARVCGLAARLVVTRPSAEARVVIEETGLHVAAEADEILVAVRHS